MRPPTILVLHDFLLYPSLQLIVHRYRAVIHSSLALNSAALVVSLGQRPYMIFKLQVCVVCLHHGRVVYLLESLLDDFPLRDFFLSQAVSLVQLLSLLIEIIMLLKVLLL